MLESIFGALVISAIFLIYMGLLFCILKIADCQAKENKRFRDRKKAREDKEFDDIDYFVSYFDSNREW